MRLPCLAILLLFIACGGHAAMVTEFCPDPYLPGDPDEYVILEADGILDGLMVSDGEGGFRFPKGTVANGPLVIAREGRAYARTHGHNPDFEIYDTLAEVADIERSGNFQLSNTGDQILLFNGGKVCQEIAWPRDLSIRQGQVHYIMDGVWDPRILMIGQSRFDPARYENVSGVAFVSPDCSGEILDTAIRDSDEGITLNVYEFTSIPIAEALVRARERGVDVRVLLEGGPVGGISQEERSVIDLLNRGGVAVYQMEGSGSEHAPYRFDHAKYMVIDSCEVLITSENFGENGFPEAGQRGNRGWGIIIRDRNVSSYFLGVFSHDISGGWIGEAEGSIQDTRGSSSRPYDPEFPQYSFEGASVTPVLSPDTSFLISRLIEDAQESIDIEQAYITNESKNELNPFLAEAINASRRGVHVRILLDSYYYNIEDPSDNDEMVCTVQSIARSENLPLEARCAGLEMNNLEKIHNKGVIVDRKSVLISSINWNRNSPNFNREAGVIIEHSGVGEYFSRVFEDDWQAASTTRRDDEGVIQKGLALTTVILLLGIIYYRRRRNAG